MATQDEFEPGPGWAEKTGFAPGVPDDPGAVPDTYYQVLLGNVYTLTRWADGSTVRGEVQLAELEVLVGGPLREGWYGTTGGYLGTELSLD
jgi:hypothetical protein